MKRNDYENNLYLKRIFIVQQGCMNSTSKYATMWRTQYQTILDLPAVISRKKPC